MEEDKVSWRTSVDAVKRLGLLFFVAALLVVSGEANAQWRGRHGGTVYVPVGPPVYVQQPYYVAPAPSVPYYVVAPGTVTYYVVPPPPPVYTYVPPQPRTEESTEGTLGKIKRFPKRKDFGDGVIGELIDEDGEEERITTHTGTNRGRYRLKKWVPGHHEDGEYIKGYYEDLGEEEVGQEVDEEEGQRRTWGYRKRDY